MSASQVLFSQSVFNLCEVSFVLTAQYCQNKSAPIVRFLLRSVEISQLERRLRLLKTGLGTKAWSVGTGCGQRGMEIKNLLCILYCVVF